MKFCSICQDMLYHKIETTNETEILKYYCRKCGNLTDINDVEVISDVTYQRSTNKTTNLNKYIKYDPTIPHITNMKCPNNDCQTNTLNKPKDVIYYRYNNDDMKYIYMCCLCNNTWTN